MSHAAKLVFAFSFSALCLLACSNSSQDKSSGDGLRSVNVPADFTFATSQSVGVSLSAPASLLTNGPAALEVATSDGKVLFRGQLEAGKPLDLKLAVPTKDKELSATLFVNNEPKKATFAIQDGKASHAFQ